MRAKANNLILENYMTLALSSDKFFLQLCLSIDFELDTDFIFQAIDGRCCCGEQCGDFRGCR